MVWLRHSGYISMISLVEAITTALQEDKDGDHRGLSDGAIQFIRSLLMNDTLFKSINPVDYDGVLLTMLPVEIGSSLAGVVFFDKKKRFKDGYGILTSRVKSITKLRHELYRVETAKSAYIMVM